MTSRELKQQRIDQLLSIVKLACLLFPTAITFQNIFAMHNINLSLLPYSFWIALTLGFIYYVWAFTTKQKLDTHHSKLINCMEHLVLGIILFLMVLLSGDVESPNKVMFIFIIITATIQLGHRAGIFIAIGASVTLLIMDLCMAPSLLVNPYFENDLSLSGIFLLTAWIVGRYVETEREHIQMLEDMVQYDGLTKVYNHRYFYEQLQKEFTIAEKMQLPLSMLFIDIDNFKYYNDSNGHLEGDKILMQIGGLLKSTVHTPGIVSRYGGEEFAILLPKYKHKDATLLAEYIRKLIEQTPFEHEENQPGGLLTISIGVASYPNQAKDTIELIKCADDALYRAKFFEKNRIESYTSILDELEKNIPKDELDVLNSIKTLVNMINHKDRYTYGHVERVVLYSKRLAEALGLPEAEKRILVCGAYIHDVGKIDIDKSILIKKMPLTNEEWEKMKEHPSKGEQTIEHVNCLKDVKPLVKHHHERYDGTGYPDGLKGEEIPYLVRALTIVDSFDAMTSNRAYNTRKTYEEAIEELDRCKGTQFDPDLTDIFITMIRATESFTQFYR